MSRKRKKHKKVNIPQKQAATISVPNVPHNLQQLLAADDTVNISPDLRSMILSLYQLLQRNIQCRCMEICKILSQIFDKLSSSSTIQSDCQILIQVGIIEMITKLIHSTQNERVIFQCFDLTIAVTCHAKEKYFVTQAHVCTFVLI